MSQWEENVTQLENGDFEVLYKIDSENLQFLKTGTWELTGITSLDFEDGNSILYLDNKYLKSEIKKENFYHTGNGNWTEDKWDDVGLNAYDKIVSSQFNNKIVIKNNDYPDYKPPTLISFQLDQDIYDISQGDLF